MYENGVGVAQDNTEAVKWYRLAADQGNADAQKAMGNMYNAGKGLLQDYAKAASWYRLASEQGNAQAQYNLGIMYENGLGVKKIMLKLGNGIRWLLTKEMQALSSILL